jgi:hypothetical protein
MKHYLHLAPVRQSERNRGMLAPAIVPSISTAKYIDAPSPDLRISYHMTIETLTWRDTYRAPSQVGRGHILKVNHARELLRSFIFDSIAHTPSVILLYTEAAAEGQYVVPLFPEAKSYEGAVYRNPTIMKFNKHHLEYVSRLHEVSRSPERSEGEGFRVRGTEMLRCAQHDIPSVGGEIS